MDYKILNFFYEAWEKVNDFFYYCSSIVSDAKHKPIHEKVLKILTLRKMLQRLTIALADVKAGNTSESLLKRIRQILYILYRVKEITEKAFSNMLNSLKV